MRSGFALTIMVSKSTCAPACAQMSSARRDGNFTPTFSDDTKGRLMNLANICVGKDLQFELRIGDRLD